jgi:hypothetical protein
MGREHGAMDFASKALGGLVYDDNDDNDEEEAAANPTPQKMEESDGEQEEDEEEHNVLSLTTMPEPRDILIYSADKQYVEFPAQRMATSCVVISPQVLKGLYAISDVTLEHKKAVCAQFTLPMLVSASPAVAFCMRKITNDRRAKYEIPRVTAIQSWVKSAGSARQLVMAVSAGLIGFHPSVKPAYLDTCIKRFKAQINCYELEVFAPALRAATTLPAFVSCAEATGFFYLHACEEFLFKLLIEPHCGTSIELCEVLTPRVSHGLDECVNRAEAIKCVQDFFELKTTALAQKYSDAFPAIQTRGGLSEQTLQDYWALCKYIYP